MYGLDTMAYGFLLGTVGVLNVVVWYGGGHVRFVTRRGRLTTARTFCRLAIVQLGTFHIALINKGMSTYEFIVAQRQKDKARKAANPDAGSTRREKCTESVHRNAPCLAVCEVCDDDPGVKVTAGEAEAKARGRLSLHGLDQCWRLRQKLSRQKAPAEGSIPPVEPQTPPQLQAVICTEEGGSSPAAAAQPAASPPATSSTRAGATTAGAPCATELQTIKVVGEKDGSEGTPTRSPPGPGAAQAGSRPESAKSAKSLGDVHMEVNELEGAAEPDELTSASS